MRNSPYWLCSMLVPLSILSIMKSYLSGYKSHLASLVTFLLGWAHFSVSALFVLSMGPPGPHGSLPLTAFRKARCWVPFFTSFTLLRLVPYLLLLLSWVICTPTTFRPICTALL